MCNMEPRTSPDSKTQRGRILKRLLEARGAEVAAPELAQIGGLQFQTRIYELRHKFGFQIENRQERTAGQIHSWYQLLPRATESSLQPAATQNNPRLFPDDAPLRHLDLG